MTFIHEIFHPKKRPGIPIDRRQFLIMLGAGAAAALLTACGLRETYNYMNTIFYPLEPDNQKNTETGEKNWYNLKIKSPKVAVTNNADFVAKLALYSIRHHPTIDQLSNETGNLEKNKQQISQITNDINNSLFEYLCQGYSNCAYPKGRTDFSLRVIKSRNNKNPDDVIVTKGGYFICTISSFKAALMSYIQDSTPQSPKK